MLFAQERGSDVRRRIRNQITDLTGRARIWPDDLTPAAQTDAADGLHDTVQNLSAAAQDVGAGLALGAESASDRLAGESAGQRFDEERSAS
jgi:hypothetical protein